MSAAAALAGWDNFYVIIGSAAAGLTGLTFVVIALAADAGMTRLSGLRTFVSPTVIHFSSALGIAALTSVPLQTTLSLQVLMLAGGAAGALYTLRTLASMYRMDRQDYVPVAEDWLWNGFLPLGAYLALGVGGALSGARPVLAADLIGLTALLLVFIGIHNVWDLAVWITVERHERRRQREAAARESAQPEASMPDAATRDTGALEVPALEAAATRAPGEPARCTPPARPLP
ncbi:MAG TPA: hypothetical protein VMD56_01505 [Steroidobacteraceae bacterium]|nr:hypothetical protein [Steroidobacteraceae bacterium]